jgi:hypothetical protein
LSQRWALWATCLAAPVLASDPEIALQIQDHRFAPSELRVPAGVKIRLVVQNNDASPEEFDSHDLNREKVVLGNSKAVLFIGPLKPGRYSFIGEYNENTAKGVVIAE